MPRETEKPVFRFAPSPNGFLHMGHACSALWNWRLAQKTGGRFLLRIEDIDHGRTREEYVRQIYDDLEWLGIEWERPVRRQSRHMNDYARAIGQLEEMGLLYPCFASRREIADHCRRAAPLPRNPDGAPLYPGIYRGYPRERAARRIRAGEPYALRLDMEKAVETALAKSGNPISFRRWRPGGKVETANADPRQWGDVIIARKDIKTSYALSVVVDDAIQRVSHVVRGMDLYHATSIQRLLQILLGLPEPLYFHHPLVLDEQMQKLSKSRNDTSLRALRRAGLTRKDLLLQLSGLDIK